MNIKLTPFAKIFTISVLLIILFDACSCKTCDLYSEDIQVPDYIFNATNKLIIEKVGSEFFEKYIHADYLNSKKKNEFYEVRYNFRMLDYDFVNEEILIVMDSAGRVVPDVEPIGIPNCSLDEAGCNFDIDKERAIELGVTNNLPEGIKEWAVEFRWSDVVGQYIWHVISTAEESGEDENYKASGEEIMINPINGEVLKRRKWKIL